MKRHPERIGLVLVRDGGLDRLEAAEISIPNRPCKDPRRTTAARDRPAESPGTSDSRTCRVSIAIVSWSASRIRLMITTGSEGETCSRRPRCAPAGVTRKSRVRLPGTMPRRCMSSVKEVIVSSWAILGSLTNVPLPCRRTSIPSRTRSSRAALTVRRETPRSTQSCRSDGIASPTPSCSIRSSTRVRVSVCLVTVRGVEVIAL